MKIDWRRKLTSRKLWVATAGLLSGAAVVGYVIGEGLADSSHSKEDDNGDNI